MCPTRGAQSKALFSKITSRSEKVLVITEGVVPYLESEQVATLAEDLREHAAMSYWIVDYFSDRALHFFKTQKRLKEQMKNAPMRFFPKDWFGFFKERGWTEKETRYTADVSEEIGRAIPMPWWAKVLRLIFRPKNAELYRKFTGYILLIPEPVPKKN